MREVVPEIIKVINYDLYLHPDLKNFTFWGSETINFVLLDNSNKIILNSKEIKINQKSIKLKISMEEFFCQKIDYDEETERVIFTFDRNFGPYNIEDKGFLSFNYKGLLNDKMAGFYRTKFINQEGKEEWAGVTQFEATDARRAFPCIDEPLHKATFDITIRAPKRLTVLSNMEEEYLELLDSDDPSDNFINDEKIIKFKQTPKMSTYLVAFFVGPVDFVEENIKTPINGTNLKVRVYTPVGKKEEGLFALDMCCKIITFYSEYFGIDFPLSKIDMIGIPDFSAGAMENWGLITYRTKYLLYNEKETSQRVKTLIAYIIGHELAHQWFGNLVTMDWWSGLWLNESFATWVGWMATDHFFPEWKVWEQFVDEEVSEALELDELDNSHPIYNSVNKATEINEIFDAITYSKGASILRMLVSYLGENDFRYGLQNYLMRYKYDNATTEDLWRELSLRSGKDVNKLMNNWIFVKGYPILEVDIKAGQIEISQKKYEQFKENNDNEYCKDWIIPLNIVCNDKSVDKINMETKKLFLNYDKKYHNWFKLNHNQTGFYRTKYNDELLNNLKKPFSNKDLDNIDRYELVSNLFSLAKLGHNDVSKFIDFISQATNEEEYLVWKSIVSGLNETISTWSDDQELNLNLKNLGLNLLKNLTSHFIDRIEIKEESYKETQLKIIVISSSGSFDDKNIINLMNSKLDEYISGKTDCIDPNLRQSVFKISLKNNSKDNLYKLFSLFEKTNSSEIQTEILVAISSIEDEDLLKQVFDFAFLSGKVRSQDGTIICSGILTKNGKLFWQLLEQNWHKICDLYKGGKFLLGRVVSPAIENLLNQDSLDSAMKFLEEHKDDVIEIQNVIKQSYQKAKIYIDWKNRDTEKLVNYFKLVKVS